MMGKKTPGMPFQARCSEVRNIHFSTELHKWVAGLTKKNYPYWPGETQSQEEININLKDFYVYIHQRKALTN